MKRLLEKDMIIRILQNRPAFIRKVEYSPDTKFIARCIMANGAVVEYINKEWLTLPVLIECLEMMVSTKYIYGEDRLESFPIEVRESFPNETLLPLLKGHETLVEYFPNAPYETWLARVKEASHLNFSLIPEKFRTETLLTHLIDVHSNIVKEIPDELFTNKLIDRVLGLDPNHINHIPLQYVTTERLNRVFTQEPGLDITREDIPITVWNQQLADKAVIGSPDNFPRVPSGLRTYDLSMVAIQYSESLLEFVPVEHRTEDLILTVLTTKGNRYSYSDTLDESLIPKNMLTKKNLLKVAQIDKDRDLSKPNGIIRFHAFKPIEDWVEVIKICPKAIQLIERIKQTDEQIAAFIGNASIELIDEMVAAQKINIGKIKKEYAPLLIATSNKTLQDLIARKLNPPAKQTFKQRLAKADHEVAAAVQAIQSGSAGVPEEKAEVELTDAELIEITKKFGA